jgi:hypothetical protein
VARWCADFLRRHRPADCAHSQPGAGAKIVFIGDAMLLGPPPN